MPGKSQANLRQGTYETWQSQLRKWGVGQASGATEVPPERMAEYIRKMDIEKARQVIVEVGRPRDYESTLDWEYRLARKICDLAKPEPDRFGPNTYHDVDKYYKDEPKKEEQKQAIRHQIAELSTENLYTDLADEVLKLPQLAIVDENQTPPVNPYEAIKTEWNCVSRSTWDEAIAAMLAAGWVKKVL